jgi:cytosine/adenosine deaminase-related metal-dependent hydrolase
VTRGTGAFAEGLRRRGIGTPVRAASPIALLEALGVLEASPLLIHCVCVDARDIERVARSRSPVAHCPVSNAKLGHGVAPLTEMLQAGVIVGLGSDSMASNNRMNLLEEARIAVLAQRARMKSPSAPTAAAMLELATLGGARAIGVDTVAGSLEVGKQADLAAFALDPCAPTLDPVAAAVWSIAGSRAQFVAVAGRELVRDAQLIAPRAGLGERMQALADALGAWLAAGGDTM